MKKEYKIALVVFIIILLGLLIYTVWSSLSPDEGTTEAPEEETTLPTSLSPETEKENTTPTGEEGIKDAESFEIKILSDESVSVFDFWPLRETGEVYYIANNGKIYAGKEGPDVEVSSQEINALNKIEENSTGRKVLASFGDPNNPRWGVFDTVDGVWSPLPQNIKNASWGYDENKLIVQEEDAGNISLSEINLEKKPPVSKLILRGFNLKDVVMKQIFPERILFIERSSPSYGGGVWELNTKTLTFNIILAPEFGIWVNISKNGLYGYKTSFENRNFILSDSEFKNQNSPSFIALPTKCESTTSSTICFSPAGGEDENFPTDNYIKGGVLTIDSLFLFDHTNKKTSLLYLSEEFSSLIDAENPRVDGKVIYFKNRYDKRLYSLRVPQDVFEKF